VGNKEEGKEAAQSGSGSHQSSKETSSGRTTDQTKGAATGHTGQQRGCADASGEEMRALRGMVSATAVRDERRKADAFLRDVQTVSARDGNSAGGWRTEGDTSNRGQLTADLQGQRRAAPREGVDGLWSQHRLRGPAVRQPDEATTTEDETKSTNNAGGQQQDQLNGAVRTDLGHFEQIDDRHVPDHRPANNI